jgi:hypothetical protein
LSRRKRSFKKIFSGVRYFQIVWRITIALGDVVEFEILPPGTAAWLCTKDKYNLPMLSDVCQAETKAQ